MTRLVSLLAVAFLLLAGCTQPPGDDVEVETGPAHDGQDPGQKGPEGPGQGGESGDEGARTGGPPEGGGSDRDPPWQVQERAAPAPPHGEPTVEQEDTDPAPDVPEPGNTIRPGLPFVAYRNHTIGNDVHGAVFADFASWVRVGDVRFEAWDGPGYEILLSAKVRGSDPVTTAQVRDEIELHLSDVLDRGVLRVEAAHLIPDLVEPIEQPGIRVGVGVSKGAIWVHDTAVVKVPPTVLASLSGNANIGDIVLDGVSVHRMDLHVNTGDIKAALGAPAWHGSYDASVNEGAIEMTVAEGEAGFDVEASVNFGDIDVEVADGETVDSSDRSMHVRSKDFLERTYQVTVDLHVNTGEISFEAA